MGEMRWNYAILKNGFGRPVFAKKKYFFFAILYFYINRNNFKHRAHLFFATEVRLRRASYPSSDLSECDLDDSELDESEFDESEMMSSLHVLVMSSSAW